MQASSTKCKNLLSCLAFLILHVFSSYTHNCLSQKEEGEGEEFLLKQASCNYTNILGFPDRKVGMICYDNGMHASWLVVVRNWTGTKQAPISKWFCPSHQSLIVTYPIACSQATLFTILSPVSRLSGCSKSSTLSQSAELGRQQVRSCMWDTIDVQKPGQGFNEILMTA